MRVLLTGGAGFIGTHVLAALRAGGHETSCSTRCAPTSTAAGRPDIAGLQVGDVRDAGPLDAALAGVDAVIHLAAKVGLGVDVADLPDYADSNVHGTAVLLAAMARAGVGQLVLASSMVVYGEGLGTCPTHGAVARARGSRPSSPPGASSRRARSAARRSRPRSSARTRRSIRATPTPRRRSGRSSSRRPGRG